MIINPKDYMKNLKRTIQDFINNVSPQHIKETNLKIKQHLSKILKATDFLYNVKLSERLYCILNDINKSVMCKTCKKKKVKYKSNLLGYRTYCSAHCQYMDKDYKKYLKQLYLKKYGVENPSQAIEVKEKKRQKSLKNYGTESVMHSKHFKKETKKTNLKKYGVENVFQSEEIKDYIKKRNLKKYGVEYVSQSIFIKNKVNKTTRTNYYKNKILKFTHVKALFSLKEFIGVENYQSYKWQCLSCNHIFKDHLHSNVPICRKCYPLLNGSSQGEQELLKWIKKFGLSVKSRKRFFFENQRYELDIYIPELKFGIEYNGLYWHSELAGKDKNYHLNKTDFFAKQGIKIIHVFENEWVLKKDIIKSIIKSKINKIENKIYARNCEIKELDNKILKEFLDTNHLQKSLNTSIKLGLFNKDILVSVMTFSKARFNPKDDWELTRFCNKIDFSVVGGFSKLLKYFIKIYENKSLISYADRRFSIGEVYLKNNFKIVRETKPNYWYFKNNDLVLFNRLSFRKNLLNKKLEKFDNDLTEWENMQINNYNRIYDCGNLKLKLTQRIV